MDSGIFAGERKAQIKRTAEKLLDNLSTECDISRAKESDQPPECASIFSI